MTRPVLPQFRHLPTRAQCEALRERWAVIDAIQAKDDRDGIDDDELAQMLMLAALSDAIDETHRQIRRRLQ
jgi:hypothetical protein